MDADLQQNIRKRGTLKSKLKFFNNFLNTITDKINEGNEDHLRACAFELGERLDKIQSVLEEFDDIQSQIENQHDNYDEQLKERETFENTYYKSIATAKKFQQDIGYEVDAEGEPNAGSGGSNRSVQPDAGAASGHSLQSSSNIRLPQIHLPKFNGSYEQWLEFRDMFESLIHNNRDIGEIQKFHYLRAALEGSAAQVIHSIEFSATNYNIAWELLCQRYDNKSLLIHNHIKALFNLPNLNMESASDIRNLIDMFTKHLRSLEVLKQPISYWDTLVIFIITSKLDKLTARESEESKKS